MDQETTENETANGASAKPERRRRVTKPEAATAERERKGAANKKMTALQEAARAEPKIRSLGAKVEKLQAQMGKIIKEREGIVKKLSDEARRHLGIGE